MPLTLACFCDDAPDMSICSLVGLDLMLSGVYIDKGIHSHGHASYFRFRDATHNVDWQINLAPGSGTESDPNVLDVVYDILGWDWGSLECEVDVGASLFQPGNAGEWSQCNWTWKIRQTYLCVDSTTGASTPTYAYAQQLDEDFKDCWDSEPPVLVNRIVASPGSAISQQFRSSPFFPKCWTLATNWLGNWQPSPSPTRVNYSGSKAWCVCAEGGEPPYRFAIMTGIGWTINPDTGCLKPDDTSESSGEFDPSQQLTIAVTDATGEVATVDCAVDQKCRATLVGNSFY